MKQIDYVGRQISSQSISMSKEKIESVLNFPKPKSLIALRSFLGLGGQNGPAPGVPLRKLNNVLTSLISICFNYNFGGEFAGVCW